MERSEGHFVLVHGAGHGAWCWYKLATLLEAAGHRVTAMDLAGCGVHPKRVDEVGSFREYVAPLLEAMAALPPGERVVLVAHSFGGVAVSLAMEAFPEKVAAAVCLSAIMAAPHFPVSDIYAEIFRETPLESTVGCEFLFDENNVPTTMIMGQQYLSTKLYQCCSPEDVRLARMLVRPVKLFIKDLEENVLTEERFGSVARVLIVCKDDEVLNKDVQVWMSEKAPVNEVKEIEGADHMAMLSKPQEVLHILTLVAEKFC